jgi:hypothetical protein
MLRLVSKIPVLFVETVVDVQVRARTGSAGVGNEIFLAVLLGAGQVMRTVPRISSECNSSGGLNPGAQRFCGGRGALLHVGVTAAASSKWPGRNALGLGGPVFHHLEFAQKGGQAASDIGPADRRTRRETGSPSAPARRSPR